MINIKQIILGLVAIFFILAPEAHAESAKQIKSILEEKLNTTPLSKAKKNIHFYYTDVPLVDVINELAAEKNINILLPQGQFEITSKLTYHYPELISIDEAWVLLIKLLDAVGYTPMPDGKMVSIVKSDSTVVKQPLPLYHTPHLEELPNTEEVIRYLYYFDSLSIAVSGNTLMTILKDMLSPTANIKTDQKSNSLLITDKSSNIRSVMKIVIELDQGGIRDSIEVIPLFYTSAQLIDDIFNKSLFAQTPTPGASSGSEPPKSAYFPANTRVIALERNNALVVMGTTRAIDLVKDFIVKYLDQPLESGRSVLHAYDLQYLNASDFQPVLTNILKQQSSDQTTGEATGPKQYFKDVIVVAETPKTGEKIAPTQLGETVSTPQSATAQGVQIGGNRIIVAAPHEDWIRIKQLIEQLDKPQPQVALEVLILDLVIDNDRILGSQMRDKTGFDNSVSNNAHFQSAQLRDPVLKWDDVPPAPGTACTEVTDPSALMGNLLQLCGSPPTNFASAAGAGSLIISFKDPQDGGVWLLWQLLNRYANANILAQPFLVTKNHKQATVKVEQQQYLRDKADGTAATVSINFTSIPAGIVVDMLPHINHERDNINLEIAVTINNFLDNIGTRATRVFQTNANVGNGQILALGGLMQKNVVETMTEVPVIGKIPLVGWFFKKKLKSRRRNNLLVLISPTVIEPYMDGVADTFTQNKLDHARENVVGTTFDNLRDPINRWFFKPEGFRNVDVVDNYVESISRYSDQEQQASAQLVQNNNSHKKQSPVPPVDEADMLQDQLKALAHNEENPLLALQQAEAQA